MAIDKLWSTLSFTGIAVGDIQVLPHGLVLRGNPVLPDLILLQFPESFEFVAQTLTTVTIRNTGNPGGDCQALVMAIHPSIRLLGLAPDDGLMTQGMVPRPFVPGSPNSGGGGGGAFQVVVFRPGGVATENVAVTWADAVALLATLEGTRVLEFDDSLVSPIVIDQPVVPGDPFDMTGVTWSTVPDRIVSVTVPEGVTFTGLRAFAGRLAVTFSGTTPPVADFASPAPQIDTVTMTDGAEFLTSGAGPFFSVGDNAQFLIGAQSGLFGGTNEVIDITGTSIVSVVLQGALGVVAAGTISGAVGTTLNLTLANDSPFTLSTVQTGFLGTFNLTNATKDFTFPTAVLTANEVLTVASQLVLVNPTAGAFAVTLPAAALFRGQSITVVNTTASVNNVTITAGAGDNVSGGATLVMSGDRFFVRLTSDGVNAWYVTSA